MDLFLKGLFLSDKACILERLQNMRATGVIQKKVVFAFSVSVRHKTVYFLISQLVQVKMMTYSA